MNKSPVFLGVYSKTLPAGDNSAESTRRWHVWSLDAGQFLVQEIFPDKTQGEAQRIDSSEFFGNYRVHAAFSSGVKGPAPQMPKAENGAPDKKPAEVPPPPGKNIFDELEKDDGLSGVGGQAKAVVNEDLYPLRGPFEKEEQPPNATFYTSKDEQTGKSKTLNSEMEKLEEQLRSDFSLALIRLQTNRDKAIESLNKIAGNDAKFEEKHKFMFSDFGTALRRRKLYALAFRFHERAKELSPDDEHVLFNMARAMFDAGKVDQAHKYLQQAVSMSHDFQAGSDFLEFIEAKYSHRL